MEMRQLRYFLHVADRGTFTRAAEDCHVAQPALSQQVIKLEEELDALLLERLGRRVQLTDAGRIVYQGARDILAIVEEIRARVAEANRRGVVRVGAIPTVAPYFLPPLVQAFTRRYPDVQVQISEEVTEGCLKHCREGTLDLAVVALPVPEEHWHVERLFDEELLLVLPAGHPLARKPRVRLADVRGEPFVLLDEAHCLSQQTRSFCHREAVQPIVLGVANQLATVQELVALGQGVSLIPQMARRLDRDKSRVYRSLSGKKPTRTLALVWHEGRFQGQAVLDFIAWLRDSVRGEASGARGAARPRRAFPD
jgi:LysR family hydrogen peroxide-inducible transcriptional activator